MICFTYRVHITTFLKKKPSSCQIAEREVETSMSNKTGHYYRCRCLWQHASGWVIGWVTLLHGIGGRRRRGKLVAPVHFLDFASFGKSSQRSLKLSVYFIFATVFKASFCVDVGLQV